MGEAREAGGDYRGIRAVETESLLMHGRTRLSCVTCVVASLLFAASAAAQSFPSKPVRIIATATAGGGVDTTDAYIKSEIRKWARVVDAAKITSD